MEIIISNNANKPIYEQITSQIKAMIMSGELKAGDAIPSMRALAKSIQVRRGFPFLPLHSPFAIFADRMTGAEMEWMESFFVLSSFSDVFLIILFVPVL